MKTIAAILVLLLLSCDSPTAPERNCAAESECFASVAAPLSKEDEAAAIEQGRKQASMKAELGVCENFIPEVKYVSCPFYVKNAWDGRKVGPACAAGVTVYPDFIKVSTFEPERTAPLVVWETENWYWECAQRFDLTR